MFLQGKKLAEELTSTIHYVLDKPKPKQRLSISGRPLPTSKNALTVTQDAKVSTLLPATPCMHISRITTFLFIHRRLQLAKSLDAAQAYSLLPNFGQPADPSAANRDTLSPAQDMKVQPLPAFERSRVLRRECLGPSASLPDVCARPAATAAASSAANPALLPITPAPPPPQTQTHAYARSLARSHARTHRHTHTLARSLPRSHASTHALTHTHT